MGGDLSAVAVAAIGVALSPVPLLLAVALLGSSGATQSAVAFVAGEALAVAGITAGVVFLLPGEDGAHGSVGASLGTFEVLIGVALTILLIVHLRRSRAGRPLWWPRFFDRIGPRKAFGGGLAMVIVNPKNLALTLAGAAAILDLGYSAGEEIVSVVTFTLVAVSVLIALLAIAAAFPERTKASLRRMQAFVLDHERMLVAVLLGGLAAFFLLRGLVDARV